MQQSVCANCIVELDVCLQPDNHHDQAQTPNTNEPLNGMYLGYHDGDHVRSSLAWGHNPSTAKRAHYSQLPKPYTTAFEPAPKPFYIASCCIDKRNIVCWDYGCPTLLRPSLRCKCAQANLPRLCDTCILNQESYIQTLPTGLVPLSSSLGLECLTTKLSSASCLASSAWSARLLYMQTRSGLDNCLGPQDPVVSSDGHLLHADVSFTGLQKRQQCQESAENSCRRQIFAVSVQRANNKLWPKG